MRSTILFFSFLTFFQSINAQDWGPRSLEELKIEVLRRAEHAEGPIGDINYDDAIRAMDNLQTLERDDWAAVWVELGEEYFAQAELAESSDSDAARDLYHLAWKYFDIGRWPTEKHSPGKRYAYERGIEAFMRYGSLLDPAIERVTIPFEGSEIIAYIRVPDTAEPPPIVFGMNGLDSRKEGVMDGSRKLYQ